MKNYNKKNVTKLANSIIEKYEFYCSSDDIMKWLEIIPEKYRMLLETRWGLVEGTKMVRSYIVLNPKLGIENSKEMHDIAIQWLIDTKYYFFVKNPEQFDWILASRYGKLIYEIFQTFEKQYDAAAIPTVLTLLPERCEKILKMWFGLDGEDPKNLKEIARYYNVDPTSVVALKQKAIILIKKRHLYRF